MSPVKAEPFYLRRVKVRNFKSIAGCDVELGALTILVGANGSGKSNFVDALNFVADSLLTSLDHALRTRGGIKDVRRRSHGRPNHFSIRLEFLLGSDKHGHYAFTVGAKRDAGFEVRDEECRISDGALDLAHFRIRKGRMESSSLSINPAFTSDRLYLVKLSGEPEFRPLYDALSRMAFYRLAPDSIRRIHPADDGLLLAKDGANLASVFARLERTTRERVISYLAAIVPGIKSVSTKQLAGNETLEFKQLVEEDHGPQTFLANCMSDGTLRALGIIVALLKGRGRADLPISPVVAIEEPEIALHPAAAGVLFDVLQEASRDRQVLVTSHSPDLLDNSEIAADNLLSVEIADGATVIAAVDEASRTALRDRLYTPGELLRLNQLAPDSASLGANLQQMNLFDL